MMSQVVEGTNGLKELFSFNQEKFIAVLKLRVATRGGVVVAFCSVLRCILVYGNSVVYECSLLL